MSNPITTILIFIIITLSLGWYVNYNRLTNKNMTDKIIFQDFKESVLKSEILALEKTLVLQDELQEQQDKQLQGLEHDLKNINDRFNANKSELNSLHKTINNNQSGVSTATHASLVDYTSTLSKLLGECSTMVTEVSARADEATTTAVAYHEIIVNQKEIVDLHNQKQDE